MDEGDETTVDDGVDEPAVATVDAPRRVDVEDRSAEVTGPRASVILAASVAVLALALAGVLAWQGFRDDDADEAAAAPTVAPTVPGEGEGEEEPGGIGGFVFVRTTDEGIQVRAQRNDFGAMAGGGRAIDDVGVVVEDVADFTVPATMVVPAEPELEPEPFVRAAPATTTTAMMPAPATTGIAPPPRPVPLPMPIPVDPGPGTTVEGGGGPGDENGNGRPDICDVVGDLIGWAITDDAILQGSGPLTEGEIPDLYPSVLWPGDQPTVFAVVLQVDDSVTSVRLTGPNGAVDEMAPVEGAVVVALRSDIRFDGDAAVLRPFALTAERADGTTMRADWAVMQRGHPAWSGEAVCNPGIAEPPVETIPEPVLELPAPGAEQPPDPEAARAEIEANFAGLYGAAREGVDRLALVDDPYGVAETMELVRDNGFGEEADSATVDIDELVFVSATEANFNYTLTTSGIDFGQQLGRARLLDGVWKISRSTLCQDLSKAGATCPP